MKKTVFAVFCAIITMIVSIVPVSADDLEFAEPDKETLSSGSTGMQYYEEIRMIGGEMPYVFSFRDERKVPSGLSISTVTNTDDIGNIIECYGVISGVITASDTNFGFYVNVRDQGAHKINALSHYYEIDVENQPVYYEIDSNSISYKYDSQDHTVSLIPYLIADDGSHTHVNTRTDDEGNVIYQAPNMNGNLVDLEFIVTYGASYLNGGDRSKKNVGSYDIYIETTTPGFATKGQSASRLTITENENRDLNLANLTQSYDENPKSPTVTAIGYPFGRAVGSDGEVVKENIAYTITSYKGKGNLSYESSDPPTEPGSYEVTCRTNDTNYTVMQKKVVMTIEAADVSFSFTDGKNTMIYGTHPEITNTANLEEGEDADYTLTYVRNGIFYYDSTTLNTGQYAVQAVINSDKEKYYNVVESPGLMSVTVRPVNFTTSGDIIQYDEGKILKLPEVENDAGLAQNRDYTVYYSRQEESTGNFSGSYTEISEVGIYKIKEIDLTTQGNNYSVKSIAEKSYIQVLSQIVFTARGSDSDPYEAEDPEIIYNGKHQIPSIKCSKSDFKENEHYKVTFSENSTDVGIYDIKIELIKPAAGAYEIGYAPAHYKIKSREVDFSISENRFVYNNGTSRSPEVKATSLSDFNEGIDYTVNYKLRKNNGDPENAVIHDVGTYDIDIDFTDKNNVVGKIVKNNTDTNITTVEVYPKTQVNFYLDKPSSTYGNSIPQVECSINGFDHYKIQYKHKANETEYQDMESAPENVGEYAMEITLVDWESKGVDFEYEIGTPSDGTLTFEIKRKEIGFTITNTSKEYSGLKQTPNISCSERNFNYTVKYEKDGQTVDPIEYGTYRIVITPTDERNYSVTQTTETFTIAQKPVNFKLTDTIQPYIGSKIEPTITSLENRFTDYEYFYTKEGSDKPVDPTEVGNYNVNISVTNLNYTLGYVYDSDGVTVLSSPTFTILGQDVEFTITGAKVQYDGEAHKPDISTESNAQYSIVYKNSQGTEIDEKSITEPGKYTFEISFTGSSASNYNLADYDNSFVIYGVKFGAGNSVYGLIDKSTTMDDAAKADAKTAFTDSNNSETYRKYNGAVYSEKAWTYNTSTYAGEFSKAVDIDTDPTALILYNGKKNTLPSDVTAVDSSGKAVAASDIKVTFMGADYDSEKKETVSNVVITNNIYTPFSVAPGVYKIAYSFTDTELGIVTQYRNAAMLWELGDVNTDLNVNNPDAAALKRFLASDAFKNDTTANCVLKYRICDVNRSGDVDASDRSAITNRIKLPIGRFYE